MLERDSLPMARNTCCMAAAWPRSSGMLRRAASDVRGHGGLLRGAAHQVHRLVDVEGLRQVLEGAALIGRHRRIQIRVRSHDDHRQSGPRDLDLLQQIEAAAAGHADVGHQHIGQHRRAAPSIRCPPGRSSARSCRCPCRAFSSTQRMEASSSTSQTCRGFAFMRNPWAEKSRISFDRARCRTR